MHICRGSENCVRERENGNEKDNFPCAFYASMSI